MAASAEAKSGCPAWAALLPLLPVLPLEPSADACAPDDERLSPEACWEDEASLALLPGSPPSLGSPGLDGAGMDALGGWGMVGAEGCGIDGVDGEGIDGVGVEGCGSEGEGIDGDGELGDGGCGMLGSLGIDGDDGVCCGWGCRGCGCVWFVWHACSASTAVATTRQRISAWIDMAERPVFI